MRTGGEGIEILDADAKKAYRARLEDLETDLEQARAFNDPERVARLEEEMDALARELTSAVGLGGRDRKQGSDAERARVNVTRSIRSALDRVGEACPPLAKHLDGAIRTGTFCEYAPAGMAPDWRLDSSVRSK